MMPIPTTKRGEPDYERIIFDALEAAAARIPYQVHSLTLARSLFRQRDDGSVYRLGVTPEELSRELGTNNWVIARRTKRIVDHYGSDVKCISLKQYHAAEIAALEKRVNAE